jgi:hypothetical protein
MLAPSLSFPSTLVGGAIFFYADLYQFSKGFFCHRRLAQ